MYQEFKKLVALAVPVALSQMLIALAGFVDTLMAGRAGVDDLAGVSLGSALWVTLMIAPLGLFMAVNPIVGQYLGAKNYQAIVNFMHQSTRVLFFVILALLGILLFRDVYLGYFITDQHVLAVTSGYLEGLSWGVPAIMATYLIRPYSEGFSFTKPYMIASIISLAVNIPANYAFIFGHWGAPEMGGAGAGWATAIAFWVAFLVMLGYSLFHPVYQQARIWRRWSSLDNTEINHLMKVGMPIAMTLFVEVSIFSLVALFLGGNADTEIAANQVAMNVSYLLFTLPLSISVAATIRVSNLVGSRDCFEAFAAAKASVYLAIITALVNIVVLIGFAQPIAMIYTDNAVVIELAATLLIYAAMFQLADAFVVPVQGALRGYKDTRLPLLYAILAYWVIALPLGYILGLTDLLMPALGAEGFWISLVVGLVISGFLMTSRLYSIGRKVMAIST